MYQKSNPSKTITQSKTVSTHKINNKSYSLQCSNGSGDGEGWDFDCLEKF